MRASPLEKHQGVHRVVCGIFSGGILHIDRNFQSLLRRFISFVEAIHDGSTAATSSLCFALGLSSTATTRSTSNLVVITGVVQLGAQVVDEIRVGYIRKFSGLVVGLKGVQDVGGFIDEIQDVGFLFWIRPIQPRERLHCLD